MKNADSRLAKLEQSITRAAPVQDYRETRAYLAMSAEDRDTLHLFERRYTDAGHLQDFTDDELYEFERLLLPLAQDEGGDAE